MLNALRTRATSFCISDDLHFEQLFADGPEGVPSLSAGSKPVYVATVHSSVDPTARLSTLTPTGDS
jgi:hypothetical protein